MAIRQPVAELAGEQGHAADSQSEVSMDTASYRIAIAQQMDDMVFWMQQNIDDADDEEPPDGPEAQRGEAAESQGPQGCRKGLEAVPTHRRSVLDPVAPVLPATDGPRPDQVSIRVYLLPDWTGYGR